MSDFNLPKNEILIKNTSILSTNINKICNRLIKIQHEQVDNNEEKADLEEIVNKITFYFSSIVNEVKLKYVDAAKEFKNKEKELKQKLIEYEAKINEILIENQGLLKKNEQIKKEIFEIKIKNKKLETENLLINEKLNSEHKSIEKLLLELETLRSEKKNLEIEVESLRSDGGKNHKKDGTIMSLPSKYDTGELKQGYEITMKSKEFFETLGKNVNSNVKTIKNKEDKKYKNIASIYLDKKIEQNQTDNLIEKKNRPSSVSYNDDDVNLKNDCNPYKNLKKRLNSNSTSKLEGKSNDKSKNNSMNHENKEYGEDYKINVCHASMANFNFFNKSQIVTMTPDSKMNLKMNFGSLNKNINKIKKESSSIHTLPSSSIPTISSNIEFIEDTKSKTRNRKKDDSKHKEIYITENPNVKFSSHYDLNKFYQFTVNDEIKSEYDQKSSKADNNSKYLNYITTTENDQITEIKNQANDKKLISKNKYMTNLSNTRNKQFEKISSSSFINSNVNLKFAWNNKISSISIKREKSKGTETKLIDVLEKKRPDTNSTKQTSTKVDKNKNINEKINNIANKAKLCLKNSISNKQEKLFCKSDQVSADGSGNNSNNQSNNSSLLNPNNQKSQISIENIVNKIKNQTIFREKEDKRKK